MRNLFGAQDEVCLIKPFRDSTDENRTFRPYGYRGDGFVRDVIIDDWPKLRMAIEATALYPTEFAGAECVGLYNEEPTTVALGQAIVLGSHLEIYIGSVVDKAIEDWQREFRKRIGANVKSIRW